MKEKIFQNLKTKYKNLGFSDKAFNGVASLLEKTVTNEEDIETATDGVKELLTAFQGESDKLRTENKQLRDLAKKLQGGEPQPEPQPESQPNSISDIIAKALKPISDELQRLKQKEVQETLNGSLVKTLNEKKIPASFFGNIIEGRTLQTPEEVEELATKIETGFNEFKKDFAPEGLGNPKPIVGGVNAGKAQVSADITAWAASHAPKN